MEKYFQSVYYEVMEMSADVKEELGANGLLELFASLPASHQAEYLNWIEAAQKLETRQSRIVKTCEILAEKNAR